jgi:hypothetical protein
MEHGWSSMSASNGKSTVEFQPVRRNHDSIRERTKVVASRTLRAAGQDKGYCVSTEGFNMRQS